jgi:hypothetical protein
MTGIKGRTIDGRERFTTFRKYALVWRWAARRRCHGSIDVCQYQDRPNDNHGRSA